MPPSRKRARRRSHRGLWWLLLLLVVIAGVWSYTQQRPAWYRTWARMSGRAALAPPPVATPPPATSVAAPCGAPLPTLAGGALAQSKLANFATVEQLLRLPPTTAPRVVRVQARLLQYSLQSNQAYRLQLGSLVASDRSLEAWLPAGHCVANQDDAALFDELREDINLRFGAARAQPSHPHPTTVVVTGLAVFGPQGVSLRPVLDFRVQ